MAPPEHLRPVPCNSITRASLRSGTPFSNDRARAQHRALVATFEAQGVEVELLAPAPQLPDLCFTRDTSLMTPWGLIGLSPGAEQRRQEVEEILRAAEQRDIPVLGRISEGTVEGGDVAIIRPGVVVIGISGERTNEAGAIALARFFEARGWRSLFYRFDPYFLHLDTQFCMVDRRLAVACEDVLDEAFLQTLDGLDIEVIRVRFREQRQLGCNLVALGGGRVITAGSTPRVEEQLAGRGYDVISLDLSELTACGGGVHCLTMPLEREPG